MMKRLLFLAFILAGLFLGSCRFTPQTSSLGISGEGFIALNKAGVDIKKSATKKNQCVYFRFTENQRAKLKNIRYKNGGASFRIRLNFTGTIKKNTVRPYSFGFLYDDDFENGELKKKTDAGNHVSGDASKSLADDFFISCSISNSDRIPAGFFVYSDCPFMIEEAFMGEAVIGWRKNGIPYFAFGNEGGEVSWQFGEADFSGGARIFPLNNTNSSAVPKITVELEDVENIGSWKNQYKTSFEYGNEAFSLRRVRKLNKFTVQVSAFRNFYGKLKCTERGEINSVFMTGNNRINSPKNDDRTIFPLKTDLGLIFEWPVENWRNEEYELFEWDKFSGVLFFDFANYKVQNQFFTRLAYFAEKAGYKGTLVSDYFVENKHGYNAHDYKAEDLAAFFTLAFETNFSLNPHELLLRDILVANGLILENSEGTYSPGNGAVVSFARESPEYLRQTFMAHEAWHGIYFTNENFRNIVSACYEMFDVESMEFLKRFWETQPGLGYDRSDEYLMRNEFMAYLMQQNVNNCAPYFIQVANRYSVNVNQGDQAAYIRRTNAVPFYEAASVLNDYAFENWGLAAGRVSLISR